MHGPLQFHLLALTYLLFGASNFTRTFATGTCQYSDDHLCSGSGDAIWVVQERWLQRASCSSPPSCYITGDMPVMRLLLGLFFVLTLYAILRYLETGKTRYLFLLTIATILHFTAKETAFIYTAQALLFLAVYLINRVTRAPWKNKAA